MHAVIDHFTIKSESDWDMICSKVEQFQSELDEPEFRGVVLLRTGPTAAAAFVLYESGEALERISRDIAGPWFGEHVRQYIEGPMNRTVGEIVAGTLLPEH